MVMASIAEGSAWFRDFPGSEIACFADFAAVMAFRRLFQANQGHGH